MAPGNTPSEHETMLNSEYLSIVYPGKEATYLCPRCDKEWPTGKKLLSHLSTDHQILESSVIFSCNRACGVVKPSVAGISAHCRSCDGVKVDPKHSELRKRDRAPQGGHARTLNGNEENHVLSALHESICVLCWFTSA